MISNFNTFINNCPVYKKYADCEEAEKVYNFLTDTESIGNMIHATEDDRAALEGVQEELVSKFKGNVRFKFKNDTVKQCVGKMIEKIIAEFGYKPWKKVILPRIESLYFKTAEQYHHI